MADRLRELIDVVLASLDEPADGASLARAVHFSRDHLDRLLAAATGESPVALRRRLLLERAAWQLRSGSASPAEAAAAAGLRVGSRRSRARSRVPTGRRRARYDGDASSSTAPNGIHFHPPAGLAAARARGRRRRTSPSGMVRHHLDRVRELLAAAATLADRRRLARDVRPGFVAVWFEGEEAERGADVRAARVHARGVGGGDGRRAGAGGRRRRGCRASSARRSASSGSRSASATAAPTTTRSSTRCASRRSPSPTAASSRTCSSYGAVRREALASVLVELGAEVPSCGDPIVWEAAQSARIRMARNATMS